MAAVPAKPTIYHITHLGNLPAILAQGGLWSDAKRIELGLACRIVGMASIKERRLERLDVKCSPESKVGESVPFYFCPRSVMLYLLHRGNHPEVAYREEQRPIVHLVADLQQTVAWTDAQPRRWAFGDRNPGAVYTSFYNDLTTLTQIDWAAVDARDWRDEHIQDGKQAEFLLHEFLPWELVARIGVQDSGIAQQVREALAGVSHRPPVTIEPSWYY